MSLIQQNLETVHAKIRMAEIKYKRFKGAVQLIAVSKTKPLENIKQAIAAGQCAFGENYVQEAVDKVTALDDDTIKWHFLGPIQSNKTRLIANHFSWVHSVDRLKIARRLSEQRSEALPPLMVCLQVNISEETTKSGVDVDALDALVKSVLLLPKLTLRGFMVIPQKAQSLAEQRQPFREIRQIKERIEREHSVTLDTLSMGMSADLEAAVAEGATHVRIGTDIFGARS